MNIESLILRTRSVARQRAFYQDTLGLPVQVLSGQRLTLGVGSSQLTFVQDEAFHSFYHFALTVPENQFGEAREWLEARVSLLPDEEGQNSFELASPWNAHSLYFEDADGNIAELIARHDLHNASDAPFGPPSLLCVSEIGLVVPDVPERVRALGEAHLHPFGSVSDSFTAMGAASGLMIVVREGRGWFPVGRPARPAPFELTARTQGGRLHYRQEATA